MSTNPAQDEHGRKKRVQQQNVAAFAKFINQEMARQNLSSYTIVERAARAGITISPSTIWRISTEKIAEIRSSSLNAFAVALNIPIERLREILNSQDVSLLSQEEIVLTLPGPLALALNDLARQHHRETKDEILAILSAVALGQDVNLDVEKIEQARAHTKIRKIK